jgi:HNH endonuclease
MEVSVKTCSKCGGIKPHTEFNKAKRNQDGYAPWCRVCNSAYLLAYRNGPRRQELLRKKREHRTLNIEKVKAGQRAYYLANLERIKVAANAWKSANKLRHRAYSRQWVLDNQERASLNKREYYKKNKDSIQSAIRKWKSENPEALRDYIHKRRAALKAGGTHTRVQIAALAVTQGYLCKACGCDISKKWDRDHIVPVSKGGSNDISNIQLLCPPCNYEKRAKDWTVFLEQRAG